MYEDLNDDGNIDDSDRQIIGNPFPKTTYSFTLGFSWKNIDLNTFWQGVSGIYRYYWEQATITNGGNMTTDGLTVGAKVIQMVLCLSWEMRLMRNILHSG